MEIDCKSEEETDHKLWKKNEMIEDDNCIEILKLKEKPSTNNTIFKETELGRLLPWCNAAATGILQLTNSQLDKADMILRLFDLSLGLASLGLSVLGLQRAPWINSFFLPSPWINWVLCKELEDTCVWYMENFYSIFFFTYNKSVLHGCKSSSLSI